jgi:hypothetical protein
MVGERTRRLERGSVHARLVRVCVAEDVTVDVATSGDRGEERRIDAGHRLLEIRLDDAVKLDRLARGDPQGVAGIEPADLVERKILRRRQHAARDAHADHEAKCRFHLTH